MNALNPVIWPFMQYGVFLTIPVLSVMAVLLRRVRLATAMALAGVGVYFLARLVKEVAKRGRPEALIEDIVARETFAAASLGYPSGHAAVAGALTVVVMPYLRGRWKIVPARCWSSSVSGACTSPPTCHPTCWAALPSASAPARPPIFSSACPCSCPHVRSMTPAGSYPHLTVDPVDAKHGTSGLEGPTRSG